MKTFSFKAPLYFVRSAFLMLVAAVAISPMAKADSYNFSFSGGGLSGSGQLNVSTVLVAGVPDGYEITGISGTFTDANTGFTGAISGLIPSGLPTVNPDGTFFPPNSSAGYSYDNLFYPGNDSPAICPPTPGEAPYPFSGGKLDIYGVLFTAGGYTVDLWSNGVLPGSTAPDYGVADTDGKDSIYIASGVTFAASPVPEPGSLLLVGTGVLSAAEALRRRIKAAR